MVYSIDKTHYYVHNNSSVHLFICSFDFAEFTSTLYCFIYNKIDEAPIISRGIPALSWSKGEKRSHLKHLIGLHCWHV